jgi:putative hydrolase of the HAD superfamily
VTLRAVLLDALGTLVELQPPAPRLRAELRRRAGIEVDEGTAARGIGAEIGYYLANHMDGSDPASLDDLRDRCAREMSAAMGLDGLDHAVAKSAMMSALEFAAYPDVAPALRELRARGLRLVVASNWDCSLPDWLARAGLAGLLDAYASSAVVGAAKPDPAVFREALRLGGASPREALHVGDSLEGDVAGARAAGVRAILLRRSGEPPEGVEAIRSLAELSSLI